LGGGIGGLQWVVDGYTLMLAALLLSSGSVSDRIGAKRAFGLGLVLFLAASAACALAPTLGVLVGARLVQGTGAAVMMPATLALIRAAFPDVDRRTRALALWAVGGSVGSAAGPLVGGALAGWDWRWIFFINLPVGLVALVLLSRVPSSPRRAVPFDVTGQVSAVAALGALTYALIDGGQGEAVRVPQADGTLVKIPAAVDEALLPSLLTLTDVFCTGHHAAVTARVRPGSSVAVVGDGAVGLCAVLATKRLGAEQVILMGRHTDRTDLGVEFGATDVVLATGDEGAEQVRKLTAGRGADAVLECVGSMQTLTTSFSAVRDGGVISRVGVPSYTDGPIGMEMIMRNITLTGGVDPARHYIDAVLPDVLDGTIRPGRVFDRTLPMEQAPDAYRAMADRRVLKALLTP
ncbi:MFS transporter, partial [Kitasatospora sp. NPDC007106]|uniref:MFS transporter n=1 Tax=Kitasatospora sp. NPDC007106 TaxID=3156914 RepID=UPI0033FD3C5D